MEPNNNNIIQLLIISFSTLTFFNSAQAECVPRSSAHLDLDPSPSPADHPPYIPAPNSSPQTQQIPSSPPKESPIPSTDPPTKASQPDSAPTSTTTNNPTIQKICEITDHPSLCISALTPFVTTKTDHDPVSLLEFAIKAINTHTKLAMNMISKFSILPHASSIPSRLEDCKEIYDDALYNLDDAINALKARDIGTVNSMLSAALQDFSTCDDGFEGGDNPLIDFDDVLMKMASNCLAMASLIK